MFKKEIIESLKRPNAYLDLRLDKNKQIRGSIVSYIDEKFTREYLKDIFDSVDTKIFENLKFILGFTTIIFLENNCSFSFYWSSYFQTNISYEGISIASNGDNPEEAFNEALKMFKKEVNKRKNDFDKLSKIFKIELLDKLN